MKIHYDYPEDGYRDAFDKQEAEIKRLRAIVDPIEELRGERWDYITIYARSDDTEPDPNRQEVVGISASWTASWTDWKEEWFWANTLPEALEAAVKAKREAEKGGE